MSKLWTKKAIISGFISGLVHSGIITAIVLTLNNKVHEQPHNKITILEIEKEKNNAILNPLNLNKDQTKDPNQKQIDNIDPAKPFNGLNNDNINNDTNQLNPNNDQFNDLDSNSSKITKDVSTQTDWNNLSSSTNITKPSSSTNNNPNDITKNKST